MIHRNLTVKESWSGLLFPSSDIGMLGDQWSNKTGCNWASNIEFD